MAMIYFVTGHTLHVKETEQEIDKLLGLVEGRWPSKNVWFTLHEPRVMSADQKVNAVRVNFANVAYYR